MKKRLLLVITSLFSLLVLATPVLAAAAPVPSSSSKSAVCEGIGLTSDAKGCTGTTQPTVTTTLRNAVNLLSLLVGVAAVIMIIVGGLKYITSTGDSAKVSSAKDTILYAVIGLVVAGLAQFIVKFVLTKFA